MGDYLDPRQYFLVLSQFSPFKGKGFLQSKRLPERYLVVPPFFFSSDLDTTAAVLIISAVQDSLPMEPFTLLSPFLAGTSPWSSCAEESSGREGDGTFYQIAYPPALFPPPDLFCVRYLVRFLVSDLRVGFFSL